MSENRTRIRPTDTESQHHRIVVRSLSCDLPRDNLAKEQRCLAHPVGADQPDFFAGIQLKRSIHEEQLLAILLIDV